MAAREAGGEGAGVAWQLDADAHMCGDCKEEFGLFTRRHHCRRCGKIFCAECLTDAVTRGFAGARPTCQGCLAPCIVAAAPAAMWTAGGTLTLSGYNFGSAGAPAAVALGGAPLGAPSPPPRPFGYAFPHRRRRRRRARGHAHTRVRALGTCNEFSRVCVCPRLRMVAAVAMFMSLCLYVRLRAILRCACVQVYVVHALMGVWDPCEGCMRGGSGVRAPPA